MAGSKDMNIYDKRLASFRQKRRPSAAAGGKLAPTKWPHEQPSAKKLAAAGFFFNSTEGHSDNVTCYLCAKNLNEWEKDDDPSVEHLKHCPDCGWARVAVAQAAEDDRKHVEDPQGEVMTNARLDTFGRGQVWWPHQDKKDWFPSIEKMAAGGWHYAPTKESDDFAICAYCELSLDGWESTDDPFEEHRRRSPSCVFFNWKPTTKRPTKRAPRASMQSVLGGSDDESTLKTTKKAPRAKKAKKADLEPEPIFEDVPRGRKRSSTAGQQGPVIIYDGSKDTDEEAEPEQQPPAQKKRATRASLAQQPTLDHDGDLLKMNDSSNDSHTSIISVASKVGGKLKPKTKKVAARRASKVRGASVARKNTKKLALPSDDEIDRALALDLDRPLTDEEEGFKDFKKPFIRPMKRSTRSRASLAVEEKMRDAPPDSILNSTRRGRSRTPAAEGERSPTKKFFRESSQDFSMPVRVPKHLAIEEDLQEVEGEKSAEKIQKEVLERPVNEFIKEDTDIEETEIKPKKAHTKKVGRGRKKVSEAATGTEEEPEPPKPKRGRAPAKKPVAVSSVTIDPPQIGEQTKFVVQQDGEEKPKRGRKKLVKGANLKRGSAVSIASTAFSTEEPVTEPGPESKQSFMEVDPTEEVAEEIPEVSDEGSVIHHDVRSQHPVLAPSPEQVPEPQEADILEPALEKPKRTKKISTSRVLKTGGRSTRNSASTTVSAAADSINSGEESDVSRHSTIDVKKGRKIVKKLSKRQLLAQQAKLGRAMEDVLKKGSESFFNSSQSEEMKEVKRGKGKKIGGGVAGSVRGSFATEDSRSSLRESLTEGSTVRGSSARESFADGSSIGSSIRGSFVGESSMGDESSLRESLVGRESFTSGIGSFVEPSSLRSSFVSESGDVQMVEAAAELEKARLESKASTTAVVVRGRAVPLAEGGYPRLPTNTDQDELSTADSDVDTEEEEDQIRSPVNIAPSPARIPLSPVRRAVNIPITSTPKSQTKTTTTLASRKPWTAIDLDAVFANLSAGGEEEDDEEVGLSSKEKEMTVAEWIRWNAAQAELRMAGEAERVIEMFEKEGRRAMEAVEGVDTID